MSKTEYGTDFWIRFQTGPQRFRVDPWTDGNRGLHALTKDTEPGIYGSAGNSYKTPNLIEWISGGKRKLLLVDSGEGLIMQYKLEDPDDPFSGIETFSKMDGDEFTEAVRHAQTVSEIAQSKLLDGIAEKRQKTLQAEKRS